MKQRVRKARSKDTLYSPVGSTPKHGLINPASSPGSFAFDMDILKPSKKKYSPDSHGKGPSPTPVQRSNGNSSKMSFSSVSELKDHASSRLEDLKRSLEASHSQSIKDAEANSARLSKRIKLQSQTCLQVMEQSEKDYKKVSDRISQDMEEMKASFAEFMTEAHATASRAIEQLRHSYGLTSASSCKA
ncbi:uncharacterized protein LOC18443971 isoform X2 [Amborella trichopoda]|uniref:uncharacterized protein LOC18443971 isoform X2 n=1 Tax=Amborella trichopoda TaxID=13333 RepID=UPI0009C057F7|nr:uncharacterized protein LOC18443971 isoform X2 [Amborella trichopoda]|eukprot:XP_020528933.1 uncharacterized protein LOC18443971 isoform X2 [Amborella trichopoda]